MRDFNDIIKEAYQDTGRSDIWLACALQVEAAELAELIMKKHGYGTPFDQDDLKSEAGDVLNFVGAILWKHGLTIEDAMKSNEQKLRKRGWIA